MSQTATATASGYGCLAVYYTPIVECYQNAHKKTQCGYISTGSRSVNFAWNIICVLTVCMRAHTLTRLCGRAGSSERSLFTFFYKLAHLISQYWLLNAYFCKTVKTQMKCRIMWHFIRVYTVCKDKNDLHRKKMFFVCFVGHAHGRNVAGTRHSINTESINNR